MSQKEVVIVNAKKNTSYLQHDSMEEGNKIQAV